MDNETIYKYEDGVSTEVTLDDVLLDDRASTVLHVDKNYFSVYYLNECYINLANNIFNLNTRCPEHTKSELYFNRDLIRMTLIVIKYYVDKLDFENAALTLYRLTNCSDICAKLEHNNDDRHCGCKG